MLTCIDIKFIFGSVRFLRLVQLRKYSPNMK